MARAKNAGGGVWGLLTSAEAPTGDGAAEDIAGRLERLIVSEDLEEGTRLPSERDLAEILGSSRPTVSQAIRILVVKGLAESRRGSGAYVRRRPESTLAASVGLMLNLNRDSVGQLNQFRLWLETLGIEQAIGSITPGELDAGREALDELHASAGDTAAWMSADTRFHAALVRASRNPFLASVFESVHATVINYEYRSWIEKGTVPVWLRRSHADELQSVHEPILTALQAGDRDAARAAVARHHEAMAEHLRMSETQSRPRARRSGREGD